MGNYYPPVPALGSTIADRGPVGRCSEATGSRGPRISTVPIRGSTMATLDPTPRGRVQV